MILIPQLSNGDFSDWDGIDRAFAAAPGLAMRQAWLEKTDERFRPTEVRVGWLRDRLLIHAHLEDDDIHSDSTADNQRLWTLGDVFEMFLRDRERSEYCEFHINPNSHRLQIRFPSAAHFQTCDGNIEQYFVTEPLFDFQMRILDGAWEVFASIPMGSPLLRRTILASFSRYDATHGMPSVLSSTSPHKVLSFHRQEEWAELFFQ